MKEQMKERIRIKRDFGTVCGYTEKWLVQHRFGDNDEWTTCYIAESFEEAKRYIDNTPDWVKEF